MREKVFHLSGDAGIERMENALSDTRTKYFNAKENASPNTPLTESPSPPASSSSTSIGRSDKANGSTASSRKQNSVVHSLFKGDADPIDVDSPKSSHGISRFSEENFVGENLRIVNEYVHGEQLAFVDSSSSSGERQTDMMVCDFNFPHILLLIRL